MIGITSARVVGLKILTYAKIFVSLNQLINQPLNGFIAQFINT